MRRNDPKPGQIGSYWLSKKPGREAPGDAWCRTWYDAAARQTRRVSLGSADVYEASRILAEWVSLNERPKQGRRDQVLIDQVLMFYWEDRAKNLPSASTIKRNLARWHAWWGGRAVSDISSSEQKEFRRWLGEGRFKPSTIDKITCTGRSALIHAVKHSILESAPHIFSIETTEEKDARPPMGRPISLEEMAQFLDAITEPHLMVFAMILANTLTRPKAALELRVEQYDAESRTLRLNPEGRIQTKKRRPTVPVTPTLAAWLDSPLDTTGLYVSYKSAPVEQIGKAWKTAVRRSGLEEGVTPYSFRHGMARILRSRGVQVDAIGAFIGHGYQGTQRMTRIYAPDHPDHIRHVANEIERIMAEIRTLLRQAPIDSPSAYLSWASCQPRPSNGRLPAAKRAEMLAKIRAGVPTAQVMKEFGVSYTAVKKHRRKLIGG